MKTKQISIVSGKGGTGKTTIAGSMAVLFENHVVSDCDVDSSNLHLLLNPVDTKKDEYWAGHKASIDRDKCIGCGECGKACRFNAIGISEGGKYEVDPFACEGCKACVIVCPVDAVNFNLNHPGDYYLSRTDQGPFVHADLKPGEEMSGGLVAQVRKTSLKTATDRKKDYIVIDGAPGIGCPATSSITGTDYVLLVTEPTVSGIYDMKRMMETIEHFSIPYGVVLNRSDINPEKSREIARYCREKGVEILAEIPYDETVNAANSRGYPVVSVPESPAGKEMIKLHKKVIGAISSENK